MTRGTSVECTHHNVEEDAMSLTPEDRPSISPEDVAFHAGVSIAVVSSVINSEPCNFAELAMGVDLIDSRLPDRVHCGSAV